MLVLQSEIPAVHRDDLETDCELLWVEITTASSSILLGAFYRPPGTGSVPLNQLHQSLSSIPDSRPIILCGDFNLPVKSTKPTLVRHNRFTFDFKKADFDRFRDLLSEIP